ncbi:MAG: glycosidase [Candidatus Omnitrophota bacterium]|jgi:glycosidase
MSRIFHLILLVLCLTPFTGRTEVVLQYFEADWDEIYLRMPEIGEIGYDGMWIPSPAKSPTSGDIPWANVGYSLYDRFDLGSIPQRGSLHTRYGTQGDLVNMTGAAHQSDVKIYPDIVFNHNGNGPNIFTYPGMVINDFHAYPDGSQPGGWRRAPRMTGYDDVSGGNGQTFQQELVSLIDIVTEPDDRFGVPAPAPYIRHPGAYENYPFHNPGSVLPTENVREMLGRWTHWLGNTMDYDGFRLDAAKHVVHEFYGGPGSGFLHEAQWNFDLRRGNTYDANTPTQYQNGVRRTDMLMFAEIFTGATSTFDYWRNGGVRMRYLDFPLKQSIIGDAFNNGNLASLASLGVSLDPTEGMMFAASHDQPGPNKLELAYAYLLTHVGIPVVYFSGNNISDADLGTRTWVLPGYGPALGDYNGVVPNLVYIHNQFARGREWGRWSENDYYAFERYVDQNTNSQPDNGEAVLLVALNDSGFDQTRSFPTSFPNGTQLKDYTGNNGNNVTVSGGQVSLTVPGRGGQGFVCYAPYNASGSGEPIRFTGSGTMNWTIPGGRDAPDKPRTLPRITSDLVDIDVHFSNPLGSTVADTVIKWGLGRDLNAAATDFTETSVIKGGFEQATFIPGDGVWRLTADLTNVPEGLHVVKARLFNDRPGLPAIFQTFSTSVYVDRTGPSLAIDNLDAGTTVPGDRVLVLRNDDLTAAEIEINLDGNGFQPAHKWMRGVWKFALTGLSAGAHSIEIRAKEFDHGSPATEINSSTLTRSFSVSTSGPSIALNHNEGSTISLPFFQTTITADPGTVTLYWDGYEMAGLMGSGPYDHFFDGRYVSGGVEQTLYGAFVNGTHFFEAVLESASGTSVVARTVYFNLYGSNQIDSDGDGIPDDVEVPGYSGGLPPSQTHPGDTNQDMIPNNGESWGRLNPLNHDTFYNNSWDGDEDWDNDGFSNLCEVRQGFLEQGNAYLYDIYNGDSKPPTCTSQGDVPAQIVGSPQAPDNCSGSTLTLTYNPNEGPLEGVSPIRVGILGSGLADMVQTTPGTWEHIYAIATNDTSVSFWFQDAAGTIFDNNGGGNYSVAVTPCIGGATNVFNMDGQFESAHYKIVDNGMVIYAACKGDQLYAATWSANGGGSDHFLLVSDTFSPSTPATWGKAGVIYFDKTTKPYLAGESNGGYNAFTNGGGLGRSAHGPGGAALEGELNLVDVFGYLPDTLYFTAIAYGTSDNDGINAQAPAAWQSDQDIQITEMQPVELASIRDEDLDGYFDGGQPSMETVVNGNARDANFDLRRFFINELAGDEETITVNVSPNLDPADTVTQIELITNLNRRDFAVLEEDLETVTANSASSYFKAIPMTPSMPGTWTLDVPVKRCGAYRINARYRVNGGAWVYYTDHGLRRDCAVVVSPSSVHEAVMYEVNPMTVEATSDTFAGRSTFRDLHLVNVDRPDFLNTLHYSGIGVNMLWLQPIHPIGIEGRDTDVETGSAFDPGSPYAVRDYWSVNPVLGADNTAAGALQEFQSFVAALDATGVGIMMDGTFNHCSPDAILGQGASDLFPWANNSAAKLRDIRPQWFSKSGSPGEHASYYQNELDTDIALAPDRIDFGSWTDVRDLYFGSYDTLVKGTTDQHRQEFLREEDRFYGHDSFTREIWEYFAYYPTYWLEQTGHPVGTPKSESHKGIDGLRCDFAQGLPSQFWEYCINKTRSVKWNFLFMAESLDGSIEVNGSRRHGVGYRSARHFDILNENLVFYWRNNFFNYPYQGPGGDNDPSNPNPNTGATFSALDLRRNAFDVCPLLLNLTSHDEVLPSDDPYQLLYAYTQLSAVDGVPMLFYGQEAGLQNNGAVQGGVPNADHNFGRYETNFGKSIPNFKKYNHMQNVWANRDWDLQGLYGRVGNARLASPALRSPNNYFLSRTDSGQFDGDIFAVGKVEDPGVSATVQDVVLVFVNNQYTANQNARFTLDAPFGGANYFGIDPGATYNFRNLLASDPNAYVTNNMTGATLIANGLQVHLNGDGFAGAQALYLKLVDIGSTVADNDNDGDSDFTDWDDDNDGLPDWWEIQESIDPLDGLSLNGGSGDRDNDGMSNLAEYKAGTNPNDPASRLALRINANASNLEVNWQSVPGKNYRLWRATDLQAQSAPWSAISFGTASDIETQQVDPIPLAHRWYYRVELVD